MFFFTKNHCLSYGTQGQHVWCSKSPVRPVWFLISLFLKVWKGMLCQMNFFEFAKINWTWICRSTDAHWLPPKRPETNTDIKSKFVLENSNSGQKNSTKRNNDKLKRNLVKLVLLSAKHVEAAFFWNYRRKKDYK